MLNILRDIIQKISDIYDPIDSMRVMVSEVKKAIGADACSVYFLDREKQHYILLASDGFKSGVDGKLTINRSEGLVGLVGERGEPLNFDNASAEPNYKYFPETGEEIYHSFLGAPIINQRELLGVIVVQQKKKRKFDESEESFVVTVAAQVGGVIAHAKINGMLNRLTAFKHYENNNIAQGISGATGIAIGTAVLEYVSADLDTVPDKKIDNIDEEIKLFHHALKNTKNELSKIVNNLSSQLPQEEFLLFEAYGHILDDDTLSNEIIAEIKKGHWAQSAVKRVIKKHIGYFKNIEDNYIRERATDIKDLGQRIISHLQSKTFNHIEFPEQTILVGKNITAANLADVPSDKLAGIVSIEGTPNSHIAIVARALNIPTIMGVRNLDLDNIEGRELVLDAYNGMVYIDPEPCTREELLKSIADENELFAGLESLKNTKAETPDGHHISLYVNTGMVSDFFTLKTYGGADGVGLYRTEVPFMIRDRFPSEHEQRLLYKKTLENYYPMPVIMRTLDVGGDKSLPYFPFKEDNPFLGWRGIRITLDHPEIFLIQIRAMLSASYSYNNLQIMLPMVTTLGELFEAKKLIAQALEEVAQEGLEIVKPKIGIMIEVPSVVYQIDKFVQNVDFISVGSNDLVQYLLAVDRNNYRVAHLYDHFHPAVIEALYKITQSAKKHEVPVSICGEMAADPLAAILLLGMEFDSLSMSSNSLAKIKWVIRNFNLTVAKEILHEVQQMYDPNHIRDHLKAALEHAGLGGLIRAGK